MLSVNKLTKVFFSWSSWFKRRRSFTAVSDVSFEIKAGEIVGLLGPNGAGKTTTIQLLLGLLTPTSGSIYYSGMNLARNRKEIAKQVAFGSAYTALPKRLTVYENLKVFGRLYGIYGSELERRIEQYLALFGIAEHAQKETGTLSAGQKTRAMLAKTFMVQTPMIVLDEPTASLDPDIAHDVRALIITQQRDLGLTVLLASHTMDEVAAICNRVIVLSKGRIIDDNSPEQLAKTVSLASIHLMVTDGLEHLIRYANERAFANTVQGAMVEVKIDEHHIADFLIELSHLKVRYASIAIDKPTLEDYFLDIARSSKRQLP